MPVNYIQDGDSLDYTPGSDVVAGAVVVQNDLVGVTKRAIPANTLGSIDVEGVFDFPKATGASTAIAAGVQVYWNAGSQVATATASGNKLIGKTVKAAADADATVRARLSQ